MLRWISNTTDPAKGKPEYISIRDWQDATDWLRGKIIGEPKATDTFTVEQLKAMDVVGVYVEDEAVRS